MAIRPLVQRVLHRVRVQSAQRLLVSLSLAGALASAGVSAADGEVDPAVEKRLRERINQPSIGLEVESVEASEAAGLYFVQLRDGPAVYATESGEFFIVGDLYSVGADGIVNIAEQRRAEGRLEALAEIKPADTIVFPAEGETRSHITVFTDVSCFYCQKLHKEVPELNRRGVEVRYLAYPRQGIGSAGFRQLATAWCAKDRQQTLTRLKNRENVADDVCPGNPIAQQFELGQQLGVRGTPAIVMPDGQMVPGYRSADDLVAELGIN